MTSSNRRPRWWQLYLTFPVLILLFIFEHQLKISAREHEAIQIGIILLVYGLIYWWIKANSRAISRMDQQSYAKYRAIHMPTSSLSEAKDERRPLIKLPDAEVKGMLGNTFEMDLPNVNALSIDDISQEIKKE